MLIEIAARIFDSTIGAFAERLDELTDERWARAEERERLAIRAEIVAAGFDPKDNGIYHPRGDA